MRKFSGQRAEECRTIVIEYDYNDGTHERREIILEPEELSLLRSRNEVTINLALNADESFALDKDGFLVRHDESSQPVTPRDELEVPAIGESILSYLSSPETLETVLGDLEEGFRKIASKRGTDSARRWYYWQVVRTVGALTMNFIGRAACLLESLQKLRR